MIYFNKFFKLPGPVALGMSKSDYAMPSEFFRNNQTETTWEMYYAKVKELYPVRYFLAATLPYFFVQIWWKVSRPFKDAHYWFVSHFIPSRQYHWLDLRQPRTQFDKDPYRYGWCDTDNRMVYAMMNLLVEFVEEEMPHGWYIPSEEEAAKDDGVDHNYSGLKRQLADYKEFMEIYNWWTKDRYTEISEYDDKLHTWCEARHAFDPGAHALWDDLNSVESRNKNKLNEMLVRLLNIRHVLWT